MTELTVSSSAPPRKWQTVGISQKKELGLKFPPGIDNLGRQQQDQETLGMIVLHLTTKDCHLSQMSILTRHSNGFLGRTWEDRSWSFDNLLRGKGRTKPHGIQQHSCHGRQGCLTAWLTERTGNRTEARGGCAVRRHGHRTPCDTLTTGDQRATGRGGRWRKNTAPRKASSMMEPQGTKIRKQAMA